MIIGIDMIKDLLYTADTATLYKKGMATPFHDWQKVLDEILEYSYVVTSLKQVEPTTAKDITTAGIWLELNMGKMVNYEGYTFEKLLISIKPKYTWLTCIRYYDGNYQGKCFNINLSTSTNELYKYLDKNF